MNQLGFNFLFVFNSNDPEGKEEYEISKLGCQNVSVISYENNGYFN